MLEDTRWTQSAKANLWTTVIDKQPNFLQNNYKGEKREAGTYRLRELVIIQPNAICVLLGSSLN